MPLYPGLKIMIYRGDWVAPPVKRPTLDLNSGLDLRVLSSSLELGYMLGVEPMKRKEEKRKRKKEKRRDEKMKRRERKRREKKPNFLSICNKFLSTFPK